MEELRARKVHLQSATWLTRKFPSWRMYGHYCPNLGVVIRQNSALTSNQIPSDTMNCLLPRNCFLPRTYYSFQVSQSAKICSKNRYFEKQIHWVPLLNDVWETSAEIIPYWLVIAIVRVNCQWANILPIRAHCSICLEMSWVTGIYEK